MRVSAYRTTRRWACAAAPTLPSRLVAFAGYASSPPQLGDVSASPSAQQWLQALETAPCLVCGGRKTAPADRVQGAMSSFPLNCSPECDRVAKTQKANELRIFQQIHEDVAYTMTEEAKTLLTHVLTRDRRAQRRLNRTHAVSWESFVEQFTDDARWLEDPRAVRLASAAYTFVATLSSFLPVLRSDRERTPSQMELHVVGARAEAMMPRPIWEELVDAHSDTTFDVKLIGDHVVRFPRKKKVLANESPSNLQLQNYAGFYHQIVAGTDGVHSSPDAFVLFNPGIGHPKLQASWRPTMDIILQSGKPALLTSFSQRDQERDVAALHGMADAFDLDFVVAPTENPFSSRCFQLDPRNVFAPIRTNSYALVVRGQPKPFSV